MVMSWKKSSDREAAAEGSRARNRRDVRLARATFA
jgi:hypothetical protein